MSQIPSVRQGRRRWRFGRKKPPEPQPTPVPGAVQRTGRFRGLGSVVLVVALIGCAWLVTTAIATPPPVASSPPPPAPPPEPKQRVQVRMLQVAPQASDEPPSIVRVHPEPSEEHKGCYVVVGVAVPLTHYRMVDRPRGAYVTANLALLCVTGEDLQLQILLDCPPSAVCHPTGFLSRATRTYYSIPVSDLELHYKKGSPRDSYPTDLLVLRPTRLKPYADWGLQ